MASIAVVGGSGFYEFLEDAEEVKIDTPFGPPSDPVTVGEVAGRPGRLPAPARPRPPVPAAQDPLPRQHVGAALARRAPRPRPDRGRLADPFLRPRHPGHPRPAGRPDHATGCRPITTRAPATCPFADPYCPSLRPAAIATARDSGWVPVGSGTLVVIEGPRFSTRAESLWYAAQGWTLVGMTGHPEAVLARELALCYAPLALVTDLDAGVEEGEGVTQAEVFEVFAANIKRLRDLVAKIIADLPADREDDLCAHALDGLPLPFELP